MNVIWWIGTGQYTLRPRPPHPQPHPQNLLGDSLSQQIHFMSSHGKKLWLTIPLERGHTHTLLTDLPSLLCPFSIAFSILVWDGTFSYSTKHEPNLTCQSALLRWTLNVGPPKVCPYSAMLCSPFRFHIVNSLGSPVAHWMCVACILTATALGSTPALTVR